MGEFIETTGTVEDAIRELLANDDEASRAYLKESFASAAMLALFHARRDAGLSQAELAQRLHTKQSSIARLERDLSGSVTLRRYIEVALACGVMPLDIALVPTEQLRQYARIDPDAPRAQVAFNAWIASQTNAPLRVVTNSSTNSVRIEDTTTHELTAPSVTNTVLYSLAQTSLWAGGGQAA